MRRSGSGYGRQVTRPLPTALAAGVIGAMLVTALAACEPTTPDRSDWRNNASYATTGVASDVGTATLVLRQLTNDRVLRTYARVSVIYAEDDAGKQLDKFGKRQPHVADDGIYQRVTSTLSDASDLLSEVRIAVVRDDTAKYAGLLKELGQQSDKLDKLSSDLGGVRD